MDLPLTEVLIKLLAAWLLLAAAAVWALRERLDLGPRMLWASLRGLLQLLALAFVLHWLFDIQSHIAQALVIVFFCALAARTSAEHHAHRLQAWAAAAIGLVCACAVTLPWLSLSGALQSDSRTLIPLGSMIAANGMNAVSLMFHRMEGSASLVEGLRAAMIPPVDTLRVVGLVHMPGIFVGMILAGAGPLAAASAQLVVLYMIVASSFTACMVSLLLMNHWQKSRPDGADSCI